MPLPYESSDTNLFVTDVYSEDADDITASDDIDNTEQYSEDINLTSWYNGMTIDVKYIEIGGTTTTDELYVNIYRSRSGTWVDKELVAGFVNCGNPGVAAGYKIKPIAINAKQSGKGYYRLGILSSGTTNTFDAIIQGRYWRD